MLKRSLISVLLFVIVLGISRITPAQGYDVNCTITTPQNYLSNSYYCAQPISYTYPRNFGVKLSKGFKVKVAISIENVEPTDDWYSITIYRNNDFLGGTYCSWNHGNLYSERIIAVKPGDTVRIETTADGHYDLVDGGVKIKITMQKYLPD